jgi:hypothetical protein
VIQHITLRVNSDVDLSDSRKWHDFERLVMGYKSEIQHDQLLEIEVIEHKTAEGWKTTA